MDKIICINPKTGTIKISNNPRSAPPNTLEMGKSIVKADKIRRRKSSQMLNYQTRPKAS